MPKILILVLGIISAGIIGPFIFGPHIAFYSYELVYFFNPANRWWAYYVPALPYSRIIVIIFLLTYFLKVNDYKENRLTKLPIFKWMLLLLITYFFLYFYAQWPEEHTSALIEYTKMFIIISTAYKVLDSQNKLEWAFYAYMLGGLYIGYEAFNIGRNAGDRVEGIGFVDAPDANGTAAALAPILPLLLFYFWQANIKVKVFALIAGAFIVNALILINSRGAFVGAFISISIFLIGMLSGKIKTKKQKRAVILLILLGTLGLTMLIDDSFIDRIDTLTEIEDEHKSGSHRYRMWLSSIDLVNDYPFGTGARGFELLSPYYVEEWLFFGGQQMKAVHSIWFQALSEVGWHGAFFFILLIITTITMTRKIKIYCLSINDLYNYYLAHALLSSLIGFLAAASFINQFRAHSLYFLILFISCLYNIIVLKHNKRH